MKLLLSVIACAIFLASPALAATGSKLDRSQLVPTFSAEFNEKNGTPLNLWSPKNPKGVWKSDYYFGNQRDKVSRALTQKEQLTSRTLPGERQVYVDSEYCGFSPFYVGNGRLDIQTRRVWDLPAAQAAHLFKTCLQSSRDFTSGLITTEKSFTQTKGYFEVRAQLPSASGTWAAFWMLPVEKTADNAGRFPEIDVFEHYAGRHATIKSAPGTPLDRTGLANITVHTGKVSAPIHQSPKAQPRTTTTTAYHTYGVLWTDTELVFYLDDRETYRLPFAYDKPMYMLLNVAVSEFTSGDPAAGKYPATMAVDYVRAYQVR